MLAQALANGQYASPVGDVEKLHPWLFNIAVGLLVGLVGWNLLRNAWIVVVAPFIWAYMRVAWIRGRDTQ